MPSVKLSPIQRIIGFRCGLQGIYFRPTSDAAPIGWGPPFKDAVNTPVNGGMGTPGTQPAGIVAAKAAGLSLSRGVDANTPSISQGQQCDAFDGQLIFSSQYRNRYWCHPNGGSIYYKNRLLTNSPGSTVSGVSVFSEGGNKYLCMVARAGADNSITFTVYVRPWLADYQNGNLYNATTNPDGWRQVGQETFEELPDPDDADIFGLKLKQPFYFSADGKSGVSVAWTQHTYDTIFTAPRGLFKIAVTSSSAAITWERSRPMLDGIQYGGGASGNKWQGSYTAIADYDGNTLVEGVISTGSEYQQIVVGTVTGGGNPDYSGTKTTDTITKQHTILTLPGRVIRLRDQSSSSTTLLNQAVDEASPGNFVWSTLTSTGSGSGADHEGRYLGGHIGHDHHLQHVESTSSTSTSNFTATAPSSTAAGSGLTSAGRSVNILADADVMVSDAAFNSESTNSATLTPLAGDFSTTPTPITETPLTSTPITTAVVFFGEPLSGGAITGIADDGHMFVVARPTINLNPASASDPFYAFDTSKHVAYYTPVKLAVDAAIGTYGTNIKYNEVRLA